MFWALVLALLVPHCMASEKETADAGMWEAFEQLKPERERLGMTEETAMNRIDIFRKNYDSLREIKRETGSNNFGLNLMAFLDTEETNSFIDEHNKASHARSKRSSSAKSFIKAGANDLDFVGLDFIHNLNNGPVPGEYDTAKNHISVTGQGFPHADRNEHSSVGWAFAAAWTMDLLNKLYDKNYLTRIYGEFGILGQDKAKQQRTVRTWFKEQLSVKPREWIWTETGSSENLLYWTRNYTRTLEEANYETKTLPSGTKRVRWAHPEWLGTSVSRGQLINCVYRDNGFAQGGDPADAFQWMSDNIMVKSMRQKPNGLNSGYERLLGRLSFDNSLRWLESSTLDPDCEPDSMEPADMNVLNAVNFMPGKAYVKFSDDQPSKQKLDMKFVNIANGSECPLESWEECRTLAKKGEVWEKQETYDMVMGEKLIKPLVYRKGAVLIRMPCCFTLLGWFDADLDSGLTGAQGVYNHECKEGGNEVMFNDIWLVIIGYTKEFFRVGNIPPLFNTNRHELRISRLAKDRHVAHWDQLILPRVIPYDNCTSLGGCKQGGRCTPDNTCYCPKGTVGADCGYANVPTPATPNPAIETYLNCTKCENEGYCRGNKIQCQCPSGFFGKFCQNSCNCGMFGTCDNDGVCSCPRQVSYGANCQHNCNCGGVNGYCHTDGSCDCLAGKSSLTTNKEKDPCTCEEGYEAEDEGKCAETCYKDGVRQNCAFKCSKDCRHPKVCRYSKGHEYCGCTFGFYGANCDKKVNCEAPELEETGALKGTCSEFANRERCDSDEGRERCPNRCGHCLWLKQGEGQKDLRK